MTFNEAAQKARMVSKSSAMGRPCTIYVVEVDYEDMRRIELRNAAGVNSDEFEAFDGEIIGEFFNGESVD